MLLSYLATVQITQLFEFINDLIAIKYQVQLYYVVITRLHCYKTQVGSCMFRNTIPHK